MSGRSKKSRLLKHNYVGTEHLLLGLVRESEGVAAQVLMNLGVRLENARAEVINLLGHNELDLSERRLFRVPMKANRKTPALDCFGRDLIDQSKKGKLGSLVARDRELEEILQVLACKGRHNVMLVGEPGSGRQSLVEMLAQTLASGRPFLGDRDGMRLFAISPRKIFTLDKAQFLGHCKGLLDELNEQADSTVLYWDDLSFAAGPGRIPALYNLFCHGLNPDVRTLRASHIACWGDWPTPIRSWCISSKRFKSPR